ncbi:2'-5' RNA ligase family protein [Sphingomicrobium aestuariivivum]|uniref:2'-5' RNA ligase family protein n=1 Tax=Sphingomicrobium aestuariivivum TaxID=1582356 RepID=UPI001FD6B76C|nr:2'-5' RNA ligase family protein [Sphingomicrobium aestuariivivum]MCJ8189774.1 2'-5' RNA ligase family protein [Sphingomicrobium aestuariivivum]
MSGALIVTAALGKADHGRLTAERTAHFPPERNYLDAHLTMFHALPPSAEAEASGVLSRLAREHRAPDARLASLMSLGRGVAYRVESEELVRLRALVADHFCGLLTAQDSGGWRPHVTIQNKVTPAEAKALLAAKQAEFTPRPLKIAGLALYRYMDGPWDALGRWAFSGKARP